MTRFCVAILVGGLCAVPAFGVSPDPKDLVIPPEEISRARELVRKLGSDVYKDREDAHAELSKMGRLAKTPLLEGAANDADPEVRFRCSRLLPKAGADDLKARLDTFLADTDGKFEHDLPGMKQFRKAVGIDKDARDLFVEIIKSPYNVELLQTLDKTSTDVGRAISDRRTLLYSELQQRVVPGKVPQQPKQIQLPDIACLLFAESFTPAKDIPRTGMWSYVTGVTFLQQPASANVLNNNGNQAHANAYKRIVAAWMESRDDVNDLNQLAYVAGQQLKNFPQSLPLLRKIITTDGVYGYAKGQALMFLVQQRPKEENEFLKKLLKDETLVTTVWFGGNVPNQQPVQHQCLLRDVALAMLVHGSGQKMQDYGFVFPPGNVPPNVGGTIGYGNYAFPTEEARNFALVKFGFWQLKQNLKDPNAKEPEPKKDPVPPQPQPVPPNGIKPGIRPLPAPVPPVRK